MPLDSLAAGYGAPISDPRRNDVLNSTSGAHRGRGVPKNESGYHHNHADHPVLPRRQRPSPPRRPLPLLPPQSPRKPLDATAMPGYFPALYYDTQKPAASSSKSPAGITTSSTSTHSPPALAPNDIRPRSRPDRRLHHLPLRALRPKGSPRPAQSKLPRRHQ